MLFFFQYFFILFPIVLITGPAITDIFLSLIASYFLLKTIHSKKWHYYHNQFFMVLLCLVYMELPALYFPICLSRSLSNEGSIFYFRYIFFFALGVWYLLDINPHISKCFLVVSILSILIVCIDGLYQYFNNVNILEIRLMPLSTHWFFWKRANYRKVHCFSINIYVCLNL